MTEGWIWPFLGLVTVAILMFRSRSDSVAPSPESFGISLHGLHSDHKGIFEVNVVAMEFDEAGLVFYVNGKYGCSHEPLDIDHVHVSAYISGAEEEFTSFDPAPADEPTEQRIGSLVNLTAPVVLGNCGNGMFRAPVVNHDRQERVLNAIDRLDSAAKRMVEKMDSEFDGYSIEGESLKNIENDFMSDFVVREIMDEINREFVLDSGQLSMRVRFVNGEDHIIEEVPLTIQMKKEDVDNLKNSIKVMARNALRIELELEHLPYVSLVFER